MHSDRELLELAAKANADDAIVVSPFGFERVIGFNEELQCDVMVAWNPLTDDGDALRLAVNLGMRVYVYAEDLVTTVGFNLPSGARNSIHHPHGVDNYAATRRAIVRAAAAIGESMK